MLNGQLNTQRPGERKPEEQCKIHEFIQTTGSEPLGDRIKIELAVWMWRSTEKMGSSFVWGLSHWTSVAMFHREMGNLRRDGSLVADTF